MLIAHAYPIQHTKRTLTEDESKYIYPHPLGSNLLKLTPSTPSVLLCLIPIQFASKNGGKP